MPRIFDNIELHLLPALKNALRSSMVPAFEACGYLRVIH